MTKEQHTEYTLLLMEEICIVFSLTEPSEMQKLNHVKSLTDTLHYFL